MLYQLETRLSLNTEDPTFFRGPGFTWLLFSCCSVGYVVSISLFTAKFSNSLEQMAAVYVAGQIFCQIFWFRDVTSVDPYYIQTALRTAFFLGELAITIVPEDSEDVLIVSPHTITFAIQIANTALVVSIKLPSL